VLFYNQEPEKVNRYRSLLKAIGSLSGLFSDSYSPYISSRAAENIFCLAFDAINHSRSDTSVDASISRIGYGIKTFLHNNGATLQKIAEFNQDSDKIRNLGTLEMVRKISELRNERIIFSKRAHDIDNLIYHLITRDKGKMLIFEEDLSLINLSEIKLSKNKNNNTIAFSDGLNEYSFNTSKSTLLKRFLCTDPLDEIEIRIFDDPFVLLEDLLKTCKVFQKIRNIPHIFLPLYSSRSNKKVVQDKSALNQWSANGRFRDYNEVYIPIPSWIHTKYPDFFPEKSKKFNLFLPNNKSIKASVCQQGRKALMSDPNKALGEWLLRDVLDLKIGELLTMNKLETIGIDSVVIYKIDSENYDIDFAKLNSFEFFKKDFDYSNSENDEIEL